MDSPTEGSCGVTLAGRSNEKARSTLRRHKFGEVIFLDLLFGNGRTHGEQLWNIVNRVELLHRFGLDRRATDCVEALARQLRIVTKISEELLALGQRTTTRDQ